MEQGSGLSREEGLVKLSQYLQETFEEAADVELREHLFQVVQLEALNLHDEGTADNFTRVAVSNNILRYLVKSAEKQGVIEAGDPKALLPKDFEEGVQAIALSLRMRAHYSKNIYNVIGVIGRKIAAMLEKDMATIYPEFPYISYALKLDLGDYIGEQFTRHARGKIWPDLSAPLMLSCEDENRMAAAVKLHHDHYKDYVAAKADGDYILPQNHIRISRPAMKVDAVSFCGIVMHECVHDMLSQIEIDHFVSGGEEKKPPLPEVRDDIAFAIAERRQEINIWRFPLFYHFDHEEKLCNFARQSVEQELDRFRPSQQLTFLPE